MRRVVVAVAMAGLIYAVAVGAGTVLYATGVIGTGATHNDCDTIRRDLSRELGVDEQDVPQGQLKARTQRCLDAHVLTEGHAFRSEYLFWSIWPAAICGLVFLCWPAWKRALHGQELEEAAATASGPDAGT